jgi:hypothetical protein
VIASASLSADVTIVTTMSMEGGMPGMAGQKPPEMVTHIKGMRSATVIDAGAMTMTNIVDLANRRVIVLNSQDKTAQVFDSTSKPAEAITLAGIDIRLKPTGKTRTIRGVETQETSTNSRSPWTRCWVRRRSRPRRWRCSRG